MDIKPSVTPSEKLEATLGTNKNLKRDTVLDAIWDKTLDVKLDVILNARWDATLDINMNSHFSYGIFFSTYDKE